MSRKATCFFALFATVALGVIVPEIGCVQRPVLKPGDPVIGLDVAQQEQFKRGRAVFVRSFTPETGLGPLFNANACGECHEDPGTGGRGDEVEIHAALVRPDQTCDPLTERGGPVIQQQVTPALKAALGIDSEPAPGSVPLAHRTTPDVFGFGLLDAVPEKEILARADPGDRDKDGISGRPNRTPDGRVGRFGRKAQVANLRQFNDDAFLIEVGITSPADPLESTIGGKPIPNGADPAADPEIDAGALADVDAFVRYLAPPQPLPFDRTCKHGRRMFGRIGCASCHVPVLETGDNPIAALEHKKVPAYTDLLLHDMGPDLADICLGLATPSEFRTEPLMGLHLMPKFLHDGRAGTIEEAIRLHAGEASRARDRFQALDDKDRAAILAFLKSL
jgi:CxxC motif-containing protein (DUF1111 family)